MRRNGIVAFLASTAPRVFVTWSYMVLRPGFVHSGTVPIVANAGQDTSPSFSLSGTVAASRESRPAEAMDDEIYDFAVIGGGCGGMSAAKEAARLGAKTILFDYVQPSPRGTQWGLGGTCVNVGCIPKKLMHYAGMLGHAEHDREMLGWTPAPKKHDWGKLVQTVQNYVKMLNFSYRSSLMSNSVEYVNAYATLEAGNVVKYSDKNGTQRVKAKHVLIAIGARPSIPRDVKGAYEYSITSDDLMSLKNPVGKTLIVGGSFVALECAGFLTAMGFDVTVSVRSVVLRGFDRQCADKVAQLMEVTGTKFRRGSTPASITKLENGKLEVSFTDGGTEQYDTVMYATGRMPRGITEDLSDLGVAFGESGRIAAREGVTSVPNVYVVGDAAEGNTQLAPVAIKDGELLARRIFGNSTKQMNMDYIPMCVFTPFEYANCGLSEEDATKLYGDVDVYLKEFTTLELAAVHREKVESLQADEFDVDLPPTCLSKMICKKDGTIVGIHFVGPNAGEIVQGMCVAVRMGAKKEDFDDTIGIHPTDAESFMNLTVTKASGDSWVQSAGCGGGRCG
ncbi:Thioredoxin reductase 2 [Babesia sp. Xinjiang]|uniref:Thioredoxin reductase 2 n=1 Tax=Babesia sp. Xinjiang TaxID=462227 RepID=UPI000A254ACD|nr:Thioredoxin reductase 2 [Babesia sp. Xinjiang]ORM40587.1 Thioredoxin reductase 2 [Babesia sp. Xinjiang]